MIDPDLLLDLERCLDGIVASDDHMGVNEMRGLLYAQIITPDKSDPLPWLTALFYGERPALDETQIAALNVAFEAVYKTYVELFIANKLTFPFNFEQLDESMAASAYDWCLGFFTGLSINGPFWWGKKGEKIAKGDPLLEAVRNSAKLFTGLATKDFSDFDKTKLAELRALIIEQGLLPNNDLIAVHLFPNVPVAVQTLQLYGTKIMQAAQQASRQTSQKLGRNDPCHCGSGKKYKKCCGA